VKRRGPSKGDPTADEKTNTKQFQNLGMYTQPRLANMPATYRLRYLNVKTAKAIKSLQLLWTENPPV